MEREQTTIRLPVELLNKLKQEADKSGMGFNALVLSILSGWLNRHL